MRTLRKPKLEVLLPMLLAMAGIIGITPFVVIRLLAGDILLAAIDAVIVATECFIAWAIYSRGAIRQGSIAMSILCASGAVVAAHVKGGVIIFWIYPMVVTMFFLLKPIEALIGTALTTIGISSVIVNDFSPSESTVIFTAIVVTCIVSGAFAALTAEQRRRLTELTLQDPLTGAENRRAMDESMPAIMSTAREEESPVSLIMVDIDNFKRINDKHGHAVGDQVLSAVSAHIRATVRAEDRLYRVGGEEFVVISKGAGEKLASRLSETLRTSVAELNISCLDGAGVGQTLGITVSLGVAELLPEETANLWFQRADNALYQAKRSGRNQTIVAESTLFATA